MLYNIVSSLAAVSLYTVVASAAEFPPALTNCPRVAQSCHGTIPTDLCCYESPGGLLVLTQFWDTQPAIGPSDSWTIHGLWPDHCDTTFDENCDRARAYPDPLEILEAAGKDELIEFMKEYWINLKHENMEFWKHEWDTHGTCLSTLRPKCITSGSPQGTDAVFYFERVVSLFKTLPTYESLADAGILPHKSKTHTLAELQAAIRKSYGHTVAFDCKKSTVYQVYYYFNLKGSVIDGIFVPIDAPKAGSCPRSGGIKYVPKGGNRDPDGESADPPMEPLIINPS